MNQQLTLASTSARRKEILTMLGLPFTTVTPEFDEETIKPRSDPEKYVLDIAEGKGKSVVHDCPDDSVLLAADTTVWLKDKPIGKPDSREEAVDILRTLQGKTHTVWSGMYVYNTNTGAENTATVQTMVHMKQMTDSDISWYTQTEYLLDKAGAYAIQGKGACFIDRIEGEYYNVVGLPVAALRDLLASVGYDIIRAV
jgi:septum formation protein